MEFGIPLDNDAVPDKYIMAAVLSGALSKLIGMVIVSRRQRQQRQFELVGTVYDLMSYPFKSVRGVHTESAVCTDVGLEKDGLTDRHWMVFTAEGKHLNMRLEPRLTLVRCQSLGDIMRLTAPGMEPLDFPKQPDLSTAKILTKTLHEQPIRVVDCGDDAHQWFRQYLGGRNVQVTFSCEELCTRDVSTHVRPWDNTARQGDKTVFSFLTSYLLTTTASLRDVSTRLGRPISMDRFRANIVVDTAIPFDEDNWEEIRIGDRLLFHSVEPCLRCFITTIDPDTAERDKDMQPLKLLRSYRCRPPYGQAPVFGLYISNDVTGRVAVGDPVYAKRRL